MEKYKCFCLDIDFDDSQKTTNKLERQECMAFVTGGLYPCKYSRECMECHKNISYTEWKINNGYCDVCNEWHKALEPKDDD